MNKFNYDKEAEKVLTENAKVLNPPKDLMNIISDLKVIGRREMQHLLRLRHKYTIMVANKKQALNYRHLLFDSQYSFKFGSEVRN